MRVPNGIKTTSEQVTPGQALRFAPPVDDTVTTSPMQNFPGHVPFPVKVTVFVLAAAVVVTVAVPEAGPAALGQNRTSTFCPAPLDTDHGLPPVTLNGGSELALAVPDAAPVPSTCWIAKGS